MRSLLPSLDGLLLIDKPRGITSNRVVQQIKRKFGFDKVGHTGTLDPLATGLLPLVINQGSKYAQFLLDDSKSYQARLILGAATTTGDAEGEIVEQKDILPFNTDQLDGIFARLIGEQMQTPPIYSALKYEGRPLYEYARAGIQIPIEPRKITIHQLKRLDFHQAWLDFEVFCSKGTYIRTLGETLAAALGTLGYLGELRRLSIGSLSVTNAISLDEALNYPLADLPILPIPQWLPFATLEVSEKAYNALGYGQKFSATEALYDSWVEEAMYGLSYQNKFLGIAQYRDQWLQPKRLIQR